MMAIPLPLNCCHCVCRHHPTYQRSVAITSKPEERTKDCSLSHGLKGCHTSSHLKRRLCIQACDSPECNYGSSPVHGRCRFSAGMSRAHQERTKDYILRCSSKGHHTLISGLPEAHSDTQTCHVTVNKELLQQLETNISGKTLHYLTADSQAT